MSKSTYWLTKLADARAFGVERGKHSGSWVLNGTSSLETAQRILDGYENGDPEIMDLEGSPLSGEWVDGLRAEDVYAAANVVVSDDDTTDYSDLLDAFEQGFTEGFWDEVTRLARAMGAEVKS